MFRILEAQTIDNIFKAHLRRQIWALMAHSMAALLWVKGQHKDAIGFLCLVSTRKQQACPNTGPVVRTGHLCSVSVARPAHSLL